jgi:hypothetical protein
MSRVIREIWSSSDSPGRSGFPSHKHTDRERERERNQTVGIKKVLLYDSGRD